MHHPILVFICIVVVAWIVYFQYIRWRARLVWRELDRLLTIAVAKAKADIDACDDDDSPDDEEFVLKFMHRLSAFRYVNELFDQMMRQWWKFRWELNDKDEIT